MFENALPEGFEDLSDFVPGWVYATEIERNRFRVAQSMDALRHFYDVMMPRLDRITEYLNAFSLNALPRDCANLLELALMTMEVAPAIEYYDSPNVPNSVEYEKYKIFPVPSGYSVADADAPTN